MSTDADERRPNATAPPQALPWVDRIKGAALLWIFLCHAVERWMGAPMFGNPGARWGDFAARVEQVRPLRDLDVWTWPLNVLRLVGWTGDQGVNLFLAMSGFGLTWGLLQRGAPARLDPGGFYRRRLLRLAPLWWGAHLALLFPPAMLGWRISILDSQLWWSLLGIRVTPEQMYYGVPAWWYVGLLLQLYLVYPWLWRLLRTRGAAALIAAGAAALAVRGAGLFAFHEYLDPWARGAVFVTRLPEFLLGMGLAAALQGRPDAVHRRLTAPATVAAAIAAWLAATAASFTLAGNIASPVVQAASLIVVLYRILGGRPAPAAAKGSALAWLGRHSYSFYLTHAFFIFLAVPHGLTREGIPRALAGISAAAAMTLIGSVVLEGVVNRATKTLASWQRTAPRRLTLLAAGGVACWATLVGVELAIRRFDPQECPEVGWGERPALQPHPKFTFRMIPDRRTRLRWESYDYVAQSGPHGFPVPDYPTPAPQGTLRVAVLGDAFATGEGVGTARAWPTLMEASLAELLGQPVQVVNLSVTGYGPRQFAAVAKELLPSYEPTVVVVSPYVNDVEADGMTDAELHSHIGFDKPAPDGWASMATLRHTMRYLRNNVLDAALERFRGRPNPRGWVFGQFGRFEPDDSAEAAARRSAAAGYYKRIDATARRLKAHVIMAFVPASIQVCDADDLDYYPVGIDLSDSERFDMERPQRAGQEVCRQLGWQWADLRGPLASAAESPYQRRNMHWTPAGHAAVARHVARVIAEWHGAHRLADQ